MATTSPGSAAAASRTADDPPATGLALARLEALRPIVLPIGTAFVVLLPEAMEWISGGLKGSAIDKALSLNNNITFLREITVGLIIIAFLMFEPDGLAHRWPQIKTYWKLYPFSH